MMKVSIIGTGRMGQGLVRTLHKTIPFLCWGSRTPERAEAMLTEWKLTGVNAVTTEEALKADVILPALWYRDQLIWLMKNEASLTGKIIIDITNPFNETFDDFTTDYSTSSAEELQRLVPGARFVGAFKNTFWDLFDHPFSAGTVSDVYLTGDDEEAKQTVSRLLQGIPFRIIDGGLLQNNRTIERMTLLSRELARRYGHYPHVAWRLWGGESK